MKFVYFLPFLLVSALFSFSATAQSGEVRGSVYDKKSGEALIYTPVVVKGQAKGSATDNNGYYTLRLEPGLYTLVCTALGYDTIAKEIEVRVGEKQTVNFYLTPVEFELQEVNITADKVDDETRVGMSKIQVDPAEIEKLPTIGGEADIAQYLQILPGVVFTGDQGGQLYIRGGAPIQNKVLLDGMTIYNPFHSIGLFSVFDVDIIKSMDVYTGGYNAEYGGRISAIMDITTRDGDKGSFGGSASVNPFTSKVMIEGPLKKFEEDKGGSSFLLSGRTSYLQQTAPILYPHAGEQGLPYNFRDLYGKMAFLFPTGSKVNFFGFNFNDNVDFAGATAFRWNAYGGGSKLLAIPRESSSVIEANVAYSNYESEQLEVDAAPRYSQINGFEAGVDFTYYPNKDMIKYGFDIIGFKTNFTFRNAANRTIEQEDFTTEIAGYVRYNKVIGRLIIDPGFRLHYYASLQEFSNEPRLGLKFVVTDFLRLKAAAGLYSQNLLSAQSDRDVVNLFYGFLTGPEDLPDMFNGNQVTSRLQRARHLIGGVEIDLSKKLNLQVEGYLKNFNQLTNLNRNKIFDNNQNFADKPEYLRVDFIVENGNAYGADFLLTYDSKPFYFWAAYSISKVTRFDDRIEYYPHWDRRHNINLVSSYEFGKNNSWEASARWNYGTGFPFTLVQGYYELPDFQQGIGSDFIRDNGELGTIYSQPNTGRLSDYHRLDISLNKTIKLKRDHQLKIIASASNIYNRDNVFYRNAVTGQRVNQLPILPSIGLKYNF